MKIFYDQDGRVVGTVDGFSDHADISVRVNGEETASTEIKLGDPDEQLARDLMDPRNPLKVDDLVLEDGKVREMTDKEKADRPEPEVSEREPVKTLQEQVAELTAKVEELEKGSK